MLIALSSAGSPPLGTTRLVAPRPCGCQGVRHVGDQTILVPTDFSPASDLAVDYAIGMVSRYGGTIDLLHVFDDMSLARAFSEALAGDWRVIRDRLIEEAEQRLARSEGHVCSGPGAGLVPSADRAIGPTDRQTGHEQRH